MFKNDTEDYWIPLSDIMTGLMMIFLLIAAVYMVKIKEENNKLHDLYKNYNTQIKHTNLEKKQLATILSKTFAKDLPAWGANLESQNLSIQFNAPQVLFDSGKAIIKPQFANILNSFIPRYFLIIENNSNDIAGIQINGYASNRWGTIQDPYEIYLLNMQLSQQRAINVLKYIYQISSNITEKNLLCNLFSANGFSTTHNIIGTNGLDDFNRSQRVEFKIILKV